MCAGKTPEAEAERAVAKRCVKLACGTLSTPFPTKANAANKTGVGDEDDEEEEEDDEAEETSETVAGASAELGSLAARGAALALGHVMFSPATRAVARAALSAVKRNAHPALAGLRTQVFDAAMAAAQDTAGVDVAALEPPTRGRKKGGNAATANGDGDGVTTQQKEARARSDAAVNRVIVSALADGLAGGTEAWGGEGGLALWVREVWRDGSPRTRATLLLALRQALSRPGSGGGSVHGALWSLLRDTWYEGGAGTGDAVDGEVASAGEDPATPVVLRALARNGAAAARALPVLARSALYALMRATQTVGGGSSKSAVAATTMMREAFALMATCDDASGGGCFAPALDALLAASERGGISAAVFLGSRAAADPADDAADAEVPRVALTLLAHRGGVDASASLLAVLVVACTAAEPSVRSAAADAIATLSSGGGGTAAASTSKGVGKKQQLTAVSEGGRGVSALWTAVREAASELGSQGKSVDARAVLCDALAAGLHPKATGSAAESDAALTALLAPVAAVARHNEAGGGGDGTMSLGAYGGRRLVAALKGVGQDAGKARVLAPALMWALGGGGGVGGDRGGSIDIAGLAVELLETYTPAYAEGTAWGAGREAQGAKGEGEVESWRVFLAALASPSPAPARVAAMSRATPAFVGALPASARRALLLALFTAVASDIDAGARAAARDAVDALQLRADDVTVLLRTAATAAAAAAAHGTSTSAATAGEDAGPAVSAKRAKEGAGAVAAHDEDGAGLGARAGAATAAAIAALEVVGWKAAAEITSRGDLLAPCQELLASLLDAAAAFGGANGADVDGADDDDTAAADNEKRAENPTADTAAVGEASGGYAQALVLTTLEMLARDSISASASTSALTPVAPPSLTKTPSKRVKATPAAAAVAWDITLIVRAVQEAEAGPAREAALALLAAVAASDAKGVMDHVLEVSAALAHRAANASDDPLAQRALEGALSAVVPAWIAGGFGVGAAAAKVVEALPAAPAHRRAPLCAALLRACPPGEGLPHVLLLLLGQIQVLEEAAAASEAKRVRRAAKAAAAIGGRVAAAAVTEEEEESTAAAVSYTSSKSAPIPYTPCSVPYIPHPFPHPFLIP